MLLIKTKYGRKYHIIKDANPDYKAYCGLSPNNWVVRRYTDNEEKDVCTKCKDYKEQEEYMQRGGG